MDSTHDADLLDLGLRFMRFREQAAMAALSQPPIDASEWLEGATREITAVATFLATALRVDWLDDPQSHVIHKTKRDTLLRLQAAAVQSGAIVTAAFAELLDGLQASSARGPR